MSFHYEILPERKLILVRFEGTVREEDVVTASTTVYVDAHYQHGFDGIIDMRDVRPRVSQEQMQKLVDYSLSKRKHGHGRWAVIVDTPSATAYTILYQREVAAKHPFFIFSSRAGATDFLDLPFPAPEIEAFFKPD